LGAVGGVFDAWAGLRGVHFDIGGGRRPQRRPLLIGLAAGIAEAEIVFGVLIEIFGRNAVTGGLGLPREANVALEYLMGAAADPNVRAVAVEGLISVRRSLLLLRWPVTIVSSGRTRSYSHYCGDFLRLL
jgi:hypothetical protein